MGKLSHDQKRKAKLKKRAERSRKHESLAYAGKKYRTDAFAPVFLKTELGIYESDVMCDSQLTDDVVEAALEQLVIQMREGEPALGPESDTENTFAKDEEQLIIANIRRNWEDLYVEGRLPGRDDLIGILRTLLHSIEFWRSQSLQRRGYLHFVEDFLKQAGISVRRMPPPSGSHPALGE